MEAIEELMTRIDELRRIMCDLIQERLNLVDPEVVQASQKLDSALNEYHELLKKKAK